MEFLKVLLLLILISRSDSMYVKREANQCGYFKQCESCVRYFCTWYTKADGQDFCGGRTVDSHLYVFKARKVSSCFRVNVTETWNESSFNVVSESPEETTVAPSITFVQNNQSEKKLTTTFEAGNMEKPSERQALIAVPTDIIPSPPTMNKKQSFRKEMQELDCKEYILITQQLAHRERDYEKLFKKCLQRT